MTELERRSSSDLLSRGEGKQGLRQRNNKEQMVAEHGAVTQSLQVSHQMWINATIQKWFTPGHHDPFLRQLVGSSQTQLRGAS